MPDDSPADAPVPQSVPNVNAPSNNRIVVAFPFSAIKINDADETIGALATLVAELAELVAANAPSTGTDDLASRARALARQLET